MLNRLTILFAVILISSGLTAQNTISHFNAGIGLSGWGIPIYINYDMPIADDINLGFGGSFRSKTESYSYGTARTKWSHTILGLGIEGTYYANRVLDIPSEYDVYGGLGLGYYIWNTKLKEGPSGFTESYSGSGNGGIGIGGIIGGRYYFNSAMGVNLEFRGGSTFSGARFGLSWKL